jgi:hypothetical protein
VPLALTSPVSPWSAALLRRWIFLQVDDKLHRNPFAGLADEVTGSQGEEAADRNTLLRQE